MRSISWQSNRRARVKKVSVWIIAVILIGCLYSFLYHQHVIQIPCIFNKITGLYCPGCGVTRMCLAIGQLDFKRAFYSNCMIFCTLPLGMGIGLRRLIAYVRTGEINHSKSETALLWGIVIGLILFGILRNIPAFYFLQPI